MAIPQFCNIATKKNPPKKMGDFFLPKKPTQPFWIQEIKVLKCCYFSYLCTLPETNISPENRPLEKEIPDLETIIFRGYVSFREGNTQKC